jgi:hypothetical protein
VAIDWEAIAKQVGGLDAGGNERIAGTPGGRRALEILLGEDNLRDSVDYWISQKPGCFTAEMVLKIARPKVAMERCHEIYKTDSSAENAISAVFLLAAFADIEALPWIHEFLDDSREGIRWNGLMVLSNILRGPVGDPGIAIAKELLDKADSSPDPKLRERAKIVRMQLARFERDE